MMKVIKRNGEIEDFDKSKVVRSLNNSGVSESTITKVLEKIKQRSYDRISTDKLYDLIYKLVKKYEDKYSASIYSLKQALMRLGPDGYAFEDYIAKILQAQGYAVETRQVYESNCVTHELDVVGEDFFVECKYHNKGGLNTGIKDVMYSHARFLDLKDAHKEFNRVWIATNTKFSSDAIKYSEYWNIKLIGWNYKGKQSLSYIVDKNHYYPVTLLPSVGKSIFRILNQNNILLINELVKINDNLLKEMGIYEDNIKKIRDDCDKIIQASKKIEKK